MGKARMAAWQRVTLAVPVAAIGGVVAVMGLQGKTPWDRPQPTLAGPALSAQISEELQATMGYQSPDLVCPPSSPMRAGYIIDCTLYVTQDNSPIVRVTEDDSRGHYHWAITAQQAPGVTPFGGAAGG